MIYTGIGSRETPEDVCDKIKRIAQILAARNHCLRSGGAAGADTAFEQGHLLVNENMQIFIPWKKFVQEIKDYHVYKTAKLHAQAEEIAADVHPNWSACTAGAKKLHTRNVYQVLGSNLDDPSKFLIAWTKNGEDVGGSRTAIVLARKHAIPVFNLCHFSDKQPMQILRHIAENISDRI